MNTPSPDPTWWRHFFESSDAFRLAFFPPPHVTRMQVEALARLLGRWQPRRVLDLCCGHGRHLVPLLTKGYAMVGLDASAYMTYQAASAAAQAGFKGVIIRGLAQELPFRRGAFDVILCLFNSFGYLATDEENERVLKEVGRCLEQGGRFLLDTRNRARQLAQLPFSEIVPLQEGGAVWLTCTHDHSRERLVSEFRTAGTGELLYRASIRVYHLSELEAMLTRSGLRVQHTFGDYHWRPFQNDSRELLILARRE
ncbi:MAG: class I SAM-dependent methyltransferase [Candidatus Zipacnadales bacterium]